MIIPLQYVGAEEKINQASRLLLFFLNVFEGQQWQASILNSKQTQFKIPRGLPCTLIHLSPPVWVMMEAAGDPQQLWEIIYVLGAQEV